MFELLLLKKKKSVDLGSFGLFSGGNTNLNAGMNTTEKFSFNNKVYASGTNLSQVRTRACGVGNASFGIIAGGFYGTTPIRSCEQYDYLSDSVTSATALITARGEAAAAGNELVGIVSGGASSPTSGVYNLIEKYLYSSGIVTKMSSLASYRRNLAAAGTNDFGIFARGYYGSYPSYYLLASTERYTYSSDSRVNGINLTYSAEYSSATGNTSFGIFAAKSLIEKYDYSAHTVISAGSLYSGAADNSATGNSTIGVFRSRDAATVLYSYSTNTNTASTSAPVSTQGTAATSSSPGWVV